MSLPAARREDPAWATFTHVGLSDDAYWEAVYARLMLTEGGHRPGGGYTDAPNDRGGPTKYGMSLRFLSAECALDPALKARLDADNNGTIDAFDIKALTADDAEREYRSYFFSRPGFARLPRPFNAALFDQGVNAGNRAAVKLLQRALNGVFRLYINLDPLMVDGALGDATRGRLDKVFDKGFEWAALDKLRSEAAVRYRRIVADDASQAKWLNGWLNRAQELGHV